MTRPAKKSERRISLAPPKEKIAFDGERCSPWVKGPIWAEHLHRYLSVLPYCDGRRVLDIACGEGYGSALIAKSGAVRVSGVDLSGEVVERAARIYGRPNLNFQQGSITEPLAFEDDSFDLITCFETIEHVMQQAEALSELRRVLAPGGILVVSTPDRLHPSAQGSDNPYHEKELDEDEFRALIAPHFSHIRACYQRNLTGSVIVDEEGGFGDAPDLWDRDGFVEYAVAPPHYQPRYIILWASDKKIERPPLGMLHDASLGRLINQTLRTEGWT